MSTKWRLFISLVAIGLAVLSLVERPTNLGLDLRGGTQIVLDLKPRPGQKLSSGVANQTLEILRRRVDSLGVSEPNLEVAGDRRIIVELPGVTDPDRAVDVIGKTAQLTIHPVLSAGNQQLSTTNTVNPSSQTTIAPTTPAPTPGSTTPTSAAGLGTSDANDRSVLGQAESTTTTPKAAPTTTPTTGTTQPGTAPSATPDQQGALTATDDSGTVYSLGPAVITGEGIDTAEANPPNQSHTSWYLTIKFKGNGTKAWTKLTAEEACKGENDPARQNAFVLDNKVIESSGPASTIQCGVGITGSTTEITSSNFTDKEVKNLALLIRGGALPVDVAVASKQVIGPELGKAAIHASVVAVIVGGILTILYILAYYRGLGLLAALALGIYALLSFGALRGMNLTLTLPGIAGFVLAIAMAMDSNVLVYERIKEEFAHGRSMRQSAQLGFKHALSAIIDSNATTFIAALTLFFFAVGEVKGFGVTLLVGTAVSIFTTLIVLRTLTSGLLGMDWARRRTNFLGMGVGAKFRQRMAENPPDLMGLAKYFITASVVVIVIGLAGIAVKGIDYGIEFTGGRLMEYKTPRLVDLDKARQEMSNIGFPRAVVQRSGTENTSIRVPALDKAQEAKVAEAMNRLGGGTANKVQDETIGPSFGKELKRKAVKGLIIGVLLQLAWVAYRFRWTFGIGAVLAMLHDAVLVIGLFAWLGKPFDAVFLAALLTIIAYSVNDSVVVFDRIREQRRRRAGEPFARVVSDACAQTFPRTLNIGLSAIFILGALFFLGGQTLGDFSFALLIGVVTGIYSSVMVASPIAVLLERWKPAITARPLATTSSSRRPTTRATTRPSPTSPGGEAAGGGEEGTPRPVNRPAPRPRKKSKSKKRR